MTGVDAARGEADTDGAAETTGGTDDNGSHGMTGRRRDDVVPVEQSVKFAREYGAQLHLLDSDHRLHDQLRFIKYLFEYFLIALDLPPALV